MNRRHHAWKMPGQRVQSINKCLWTARRPKLEHVGDFLPEPCFVSDPTGSKRWQRTLQTGYERSILNQSEHPGAGKSATWGAQRCNSSSGKYKQKALTDDPPGVMRNPWHIPSGSSPRS